MLQFAFQPVESALTTAKQLQGTKTINTDSLLHREPTCSLLRVPHREATPTSSRTITVHEHTERSTHMQTQPSPVVDQHFLHLIQMEPLPHVITVIMLHGAHWWIQNTPVPSSHARLRVCGHPSAPILAVSHSSCCF